MQKIILDVSKKDAATKNHVKVGSVDIFVPLLAGIGLIVEMQKDAEGKEITTDDGLPVYADAKHNWLQNAIFTQVKAQARNKLVSGTATLKSGLTIATNWDELTAEGGGNSGEGLAKIREVKALFAAWAATLGKSEGAQATMNMLFGNKNALALQSEVNRGKIADYVTSFAETLKPEQAERYGNYLESVITACSSEAAEDF